MEAQHINIEVSVLRLEDGRYVAMSRDVPLMAVARDLDTLRRDVTSLVTKLDVRFGRRGIDEPREPLRERGKGIPPPPSGQWCQPMSFSVPVAVRAAG